MNNFIEEEKKAYEKWRNQHADVHHTGENTPPEWFVRNYVESRLIPLLESALLSQLKEVDGNLEGMMKIEDKDLSGRDYLIKGYNKALSDIREGLK